MNAAFWRFAHRHYQSKRPTRLIDAAAFAWFVFFVVVYGGALISGWVPDLIGAAVGLLLVGGPLAIGLLHRRIRVEAAKGRDALYRKRLEAERS